ncbi:MAG: hypothetical protein Q4D23_07170 [Bacteroidales bacterium]|nr:hypothetical protein [Bacteroidales bacterium]
MKKTFFTIVALGMGLAAFAQRPDMPKADVKATPAKTGNFVWRHQVSGFVAPKPAAPAKKANHLYPGVLPDGENHVWAYTAFNQERWSKQQSLLKFTTNQLSPNDMTQIAAFDRTKLENTATDISALTFVGNELWASMRRPFDLGYFYMKGLYQIDVETGDYKTAQNGLYRWYDAESDDVEITNNNYNPNLPLMMDMSYDPTTGLLWYVAPELNGGIVFDGFFRAQEWNVGYLNTKAANPEPVKLYTSKLCIANIVADHGVLYGLGEEPFYTGDVDPETGYDVVDIKTSFVSLTPNVATGNCTLNVIREYDADELYVSPPDFWVGGHLVNSSMELDRDNHRLYVAYNNVLDGNFYWDELDPKTGKVLKHEFQSELLGIKSLAIPYQDCNDDAPTNVTNLVVTAGSNGSDNTTLIWNDPVSCYYDRSKAPAIKKINIYRDDKLIGSVPADEEEYIDMKVPFGLYKYTVVAENAAGEGLKESRTVFVGKDTPGAPLNATLTTNGDEATITWEAPVTGAHGTWFDAESTTYSITRNPDNVVVAQNIPGYTYVDKVPSVKSYSYTITASNHEGEGLSATTNLISFGPNIELPYEVDFTDLDGFNSWQVIDHNQDGFKWQYGWYATHKEEVGQCAQYDATFCGNKPADYLLSPVFKTVKGEEYKLDYDVMVHNYRDTDEQFGWYNGNADAYPGVNNSLNRFEEGSYDAAYGLTWYHRQGVFEANDDQQRVAFSVLSRPLMGILYLKNAVIRHYSATDLGVDHINASSIGTVYRPLPITVYVKNEGKKTVKNFKIRVYDKDETSIAEQEFNEPIYSEEIMPYTVQWTPKALGLNEVYAEIIFEEDTYKGDNINKQALRIDVTDQAEGDWRTVLTKDEIAPGGWCAINAPCSRSQALYLAEELQLNKGDIITGIGFIYNGRPCFEGFNNIEFEVNLGSTSLDMIYDYWRAQHEWQTYDAHFLRSEYFPHNAFYGFTKVNCTEGEGQLLFPFQNPYVYDGENLLIDIIRTESTKLSEEFLTFYCDVQDKNQDIDLIEESRGRAIDRWGESELPDGGIAFPCGGYNAIPVLILGYSDATGIHGIKTVSSNLTVNHRGDELLLSDECTNVIVNDLQGRTVARLAKGNVVKVPAALHGACVVTATLSNGKTTTVKAAL